MGQVVYTFLGKNEHQLFVTIKSDFAFSSIVTTIYSEDCSPLILGLNTQQTLDDLQPYFTQCIPAWLIPAGLRVHPGKQQIRNHKYRCNSVFIAIYISKIKQYLEIAAISPYCLSGPVMFQITVKYFYFRIIVIYCMAYERGYKRYIADSRGYFPP